MIISNIKINKIDNNEKVKGYVSFILDDEFAVHGARIINGTKGLFVAMPSKKNATGGFNDICHPVNKTLRETIDKTIIEEFLREGN